jgi:Asp-tRNA(Asn)/Glu-tRNA(Gln) amidotransferase A subunit family amidase
MDTEVDDLHYLELVELAALIKVRKISPLEVVRAQLDRIAALDGELGSYVHVMADAAMAQAKTAQAEIAAGKYRGPLHGVPIALKDLFWTKDFPTAAVADWVPNCAVEAAVAHEATYPARKDEYGPVLASVIEAGRALSGLDYQKILLRRLELRGRIASLFETIDLLLIPVHPFPPLTLAVIRTLGEQPDLIARLQEYTCPFDTTGHPTITLPGGFSATGLPIAFQLVAANLDEATLLRAGAAFQRVTSWHRRHPSLASWRQP